MEQREKKSPQINLLTQLVLDNYDSANEAKKRKPSEIQ